MFEKIDLVAGEQEVSLELEVLNTSSEKRSTQEIDVLCIRK